MSKHKEEFKQFSVKFPKTFVEEIDLICSANYITRTSWLIRAAKLLMEKERIVRTEELLAKMSDNEK